MRLVLVFLLAFASANLYAQDTTCGIAWGPVINLSGPPPYAFEPHIATQGDTIHVTWLQDPGGFRLPYVRSVDGGLTWEPVREMLTDTTIYDRIVNDPWVIASRSWVYLIFVGPNNSGNTPVYLMRSSDRGTIWGPPQPINAEITSQVHLATLSNDTLIVYYPRSFGPRRIARSTNGGASWDTSLAVVNQPVELSGGILHSTYPIGINSHFEIAHLRSTNLGDSWQDSTVLSAIDGYGSDLPALGLTRTNPPSIFVTWRDSKYGCMGFVGCSVILRRSSNNGASWLPETVLTDQPNGYNRDGQQISSSGNTVAACWMDDFATHINLRYSVDGGERWSDLCDVTPGRIALDPACVVNGSVVHVVWNDRLPTHWTIHYRRGVIISTSIKEPEPAPTSFVLHQNFPNPFNPSTTIQYEIAKRGLVSLKVYDFLGQEIATLVNNEEDAGGHEVKWEPKNRASGMYYYRMSVSGGATHSKTRAMMLLR